MLNSGEKPDGSKSHADISTLQTQKLIPAKKDEAKGPYETKIPHQVNFVEAVRAHKDPKVPVEIGHSSCTVCTLGNIACQLKRTVKWDPAKQVFVDDTDGAATKMMHYEYRQGYFTLIN